MLHLHTHDTAHSSLPCLTANFGLRFRATGVTVHWRQHSLDHSRAQHAANIKVQCPLPPPPPSLNYADSMSDKQCMQQQQSIWTQQPVFLHAAPRTVTRDNPARAKSHRWWPDPLITQA